MKVSESIKLKELVNDIYSGKVDPVELKNQFGVEDYLEQLYPSNLKKLAGDYILENVGLSNIIDRQAMKTFFKGCQEKLNIVLFYANLPNGEQCKTLTQLKD